MYIYGGLAYYPDGSYAIASNLVCLHTSVYATRSTTKLILSTAYFHNGRILVTCPSGHFHGIPLRTLLDEYSLENFNKQSSVLKSAQVFLPDERE